MQGHILPCRYCGAPTRMEGWGRDAVRIVNPDGTLHQCHEAERAKAIGNIFWGQVEDLCAPLSPEEVLLQLEKLYDWAQVSICDFEETELYALNAAIEMLKLVLGIRPRDLVSKITE